jgi:hypothetical protein
LLKKQDAEETGRLEGCTEREREERRVEFEGRIGNCDERERYRI